MVFCSRQPQHTQPSTPNIIQTTPNIAQQQPHQHHHHQHQRHQVLSYLTDVRCAPLTGDDAGSFRLTFAFRENPHFTNATLEKTFYMEDPDEVVPRKFVGSKARAGGGREGGLFVVAS